MRSLSPFVQARCRAQPAASKHLRVTAGLLTVAASFAWIGAAVASGMAASIVPWLITLLLVALAGLTHIVNHPDAENREGVGRLWESFSASYLSFSILMCIWLSISAKTPPPKTLSQRQFIDIELTSSADFEDRKDPLPGTKEYDALRKRTGSTEKTKMAMMPKPDKTDKRDERAQQRTEETGEPAPRPTAEKKASTMVRRQIKSQPVKNLMAARVPDSSNSVRTSEEEQSRVPDFKPPAGWRVFEAARPLAASTPMKKSGLKTQSHAARDSLIMEEAAPVELMELADNDGDAGVEIFQSGGRSKGGKGQTSNLQVYLKLLHQRIKRAWSPPHGDPRAAELLFRIARNGKLTSVTLLRTSGAPAADAAAIKAITACAPFSTLPEDFKSEYLDIRYTFNYRVDELSEVSGGRYQ